MKRVIPPVDFASAIVEPAIEAATMISGKKRVVNTTARQGTQILSDKNLGYLVPTQKQRKNLVMAFVEQDMIVYGRAFDMAKLFEPVNLDDPADIKAKLDSIQLCEIKSTNKVNIGPDFRGYFFGLTAAEVLVAQSLKQQFKFVLVNTLTKHHLELGLSEMFGRAKGIYPTWSILL